MKFFYPDSQDFVDPLYDFDAEKHPPHRVRQRGDAYAHELLRKAPYDGFLVSKAIVDARRGRGRYSEGQRQRFLRNGVHRFFRTGNGGCAGARKKRLLMMGDCGAYAYIDEDKPPHSISEVLDFYQSCGFDYVLSVDHIIPVFLEKKAPEQWRERQEMTLSLADVFLREHQARSLGSVPIGIAQGWNAPSYVQAARALEKMGYEYVALGGLAPLATKNIMSVVEAVGRATSQRTRLHLLGVSRPAHFAFFRRWGVASFDSTMPLRQAFMDDRHNYHTPEKAYLAIRVPQVVGNRQLQRKIRRGVVSADEAFRLERDCLRVLNNFGADQATADEVLEVVGSYEALFNGRIQTAGYRVLLEECPWKCCSCQICRDIGIHVVLLRGRERNKRRGFHNMHVLDQKIRRAFPSSEKQ